MKRIVACLLLVCVLFSLTACGNSELAMQLLMENADNSPLLYKVTDGQGNTVWLFGSIHVGQESFYPLPDYVMDAYNGSDALAVEFDVLTYQEDMQAMMADMQLMIYTDGTTIKDHIPQELYEECVQILKENNSYNAMLDYYYPSMWSQFIDSFAMEQAGANTELGIDMHFLELAHEEGKTIIDIESGSFQFGMLAGFSDELQAMLLESSVESYTMPEMYSQSLQLMLDAWQSGDEYTLELLTQTNSHLVAEDEKALYAEYNDALVTQRNINMADFAQEALASGQELFICVGAAHVVGDGGMADLLKERGYTVTIVQ